MDILFGDVDASVRAADVERVMHKDMVKRDIEDEEAAGKGTAVRLEDVGVSPEVKTG